MSGPLTILGGGVCGLAMAAELSSRGAEVVVVDPDGPPGEHACSWWAGGMLAPECEGVLTEPDVVRRGRTAADWWAGHGVEVTRNGTLVVALGRDQSELMTFARRAAAPPLSNGWTGRALQRSSRIWVTSLPRRCSSNPKRIWTRAPR